MRLLVLKLTLITFLRVTSCVYSQMGITCIFDGPLEGGLPKGIELFVYQNIPDLSIFGLGSANNGGGSDGEEFSFPAGPTSAGNYIYIASETDGFNSWFGFYPDFTTGAMSINGDDAIELFMDGIVIDVFGDPDQDGTGTDWEYTDGWAASNLGRSISTIFNINDWSFSGINALDGDTTNTSAANPVPIGMFTVVPVDLVEFNAIFFTNRVILTWKTAAENNNLGFEIEKSEDISPNIVKWCIVGFVKGKGNTTLPNSYLFIDNIVQHLYKSLNYRLKQIDLDGSFSYSNVVNVKIGNEDKIYLADCYPNPFNAQTEIIFEIPERLFVNLSVFNILGKEVAILIEEYLNAGYHNVKFDASSVSRSVNRRITSGIYLYRLSAGKYIQTKKMILIK